MVDSHPAEISRSVKWLKWQSRVLTEWGILTKWESTESPHFHMGHYDLFSAVLALSIQDLY